MTVNSDEWGRSACGAVWTVRLWFCGFCSARGCVHWAVACSLIPLIYWEPVMHAQHVMHATIVASVSFLGLRSLQCMRAALTLPHAFTRAATIQMLKRAATMSCPRIAATQSQAHARADFTACIHARRHDTNAETRRHNVSSTHSSHAEPGTRTHACHRLVISSMNACMQCPRAAASQPCVASLDSSVLGSERAASPRFIVCSVSSVQRLTV